MNNWKSVHLREVASVFNGKTPSMSEHRSEGHPVLKIKDVDEYGSFRGAYESFVDPDLAAVYADRVIHDGDTLILNAAHNASYVGSKTYRAQAQVVGALATGEWLVIRPDRALLDAGYVHHWVNTPRTRRELRNVVKGIHLYPKEVSRLAVALPPLDEQRRIAEVLDRVEALRAKRREAIAHLDTLAHSIFLDMFGDDCTYDSVDTTVAGVADARRGAIRTGPFGSQLLHSEFRSSGIAVLGIDNAVDNEFKWGKPRYISTAKYRALERYTVHPGDVLITIMGTCGRCAIVPDDIPPAINTKHLCCISLDRSRCLPGFLQAYFLIHPLARRYLEKRAKGAVMDGLNMGLIRDMPLSLPTIRLQQVFVDRAAAVTEHRSKLRSSLAGFDALFASLQHRAFRGEL